jgi:ribonuclease E
MTKRMLIDATHAEETRVVVLDGNRLEDFDVETSTKKQLKGNIYLAKVVRVEPSLQAAFVEYGGGRHGFLAFGEIHPDYYQIPIADRQRLIELQAEEARAEEEEEESVLPTEPAESARELTGEQPRIEFIEAEPAQTEALSAHETPAEESRAEEQSPAEETSPVEQIETEPVSAQAESVPHENPGLPRAPEEPPAVVAEEDPHQHQDEEPPFRPAQPALITREERFATADAVAEQPEIHSGQSDSDGPVATGHDEATPDIAGNLEVIEAEPDENEAAESDGTDFDTSPVDLRPPETIGGYTGDDSAEEMRTRRTARFLRNYRIQEVIKRRQILLVQVVKEERGTKGAALTTYISLAGRFCVLMPNSPRGGGISRKITSPADRRRLKEITAELDIPQGMGLIVRTAGANRPKPEIKRDCEYLMRLWDDIREHTLRSVAPALIYEEASLIKRAIRDVYSRDIDDVFVDGEEGWRAAHDFMRMLMPAHARKVQLWRADGGGSLFSKYQVDVQLDAMLSPTVQLRSGGYLVINQTEALVAIDVNSGRSTRERGIEETALRTNLEAADEVARQLRLRDLAGLIVIDFIDMEARKHNTMVERRLKEALKSDRARIQVGHISHFGLLEMSRQRLRPSLAETSFVMCTHCGGTGHVRSIESSAIHVLRGIEEEGAKGRASLIMVHMASAVVMYILNNKRDRVAEIESRTAMRVQFTSDDTLIPPQMRIDRLKPQVPDAERPQHLPVAPAAPIEAAEEEAGEYAEAGEQPAPPIATPAAPEEPTGEERAGERMGEDADRRRRRRRRRRSGRRDGVADGMQPGTVDEAAGEEGGEEVADEAGPVEDEAPDFATAPESDEEAAGGLTPEPAAPEVAQDVTQESEEAPGRRRGRRGGRRRRRDEATPQELGTEQPPFPAYTGPTPADPFGGVTYDIFDLLEQSARPAPSVVALPAEPGALQPEVEATAPPVENAAQEAVPPAQPEAMSAPDAPAGESEAPHAAPHRPEVEAEAAEATVPADAPEPEAASHVVQPIVIGRDELPVTERKRGWWRR